MTASATRPATIPSSMRVYAVGDVHGMANLLEDAFQRIDRDLAANPVAVATEVYLGDMVDRGPDSLRVLSALVARADSRHVICLLGNHELMMIRALGDLTVLDEWLKLGGLATLQSFGLPAASIKVNAATQREFRKRLTPPLLDFLMSLQRSYTVGDYVFVHAGIRPGVPFALQDLADITGIRGEFLKSDVPFGFVVVHGHTPCEAVDVRSNRINIDTGAYKTGVLSCLAFEGTTIRRL